MSKTIQRSALSAMTATLSLLITTLAGAAQLQVTVTTPDGKPAADVAVLVQPTAAWTPQPLPEPVVIAQQNIRFTPFVTVVPVGGTVRFVNKDRYDHHVRSQPGGPLGNVAPAQQFELRMAGLVAGKPPSQADQKLEVPGSIALGCHLHGSMRGHVLVSNTPWYAVTDEKGVATIANLPDGQVDVKLWHPDQLTDQASSRVQAAGTLSTEARLNFSPRRRTPASSSNPEKY